VKRIMVKKANKDNQIYDLQLKMGLKRHLPSLITIL